MKTVIKRIFCLALLAGLVYSVSNAQAKQPDQEDPEPIFALEEDDPVILSAYESILPLKYDTLDWANYPDMRIIESDDKRIRLLTFPTGQEKTWDYLHELRYNVAPNETRSSSLQDSRFFYLRNYQSLIIDRIYTLSKDIYLLEGVNRGNEYFLMGIDIGRGIARSAYVFPEQSYLITTSFDTLEYTLEDVRAEFQGNRLRLPEWDENQFTGDYVYLYFNGAHYEYGADFANTLSEMEGGKDIITRIDFKDEDNRWLVQELYAGQPYSVVVKVASEDRTIQEPVSLQLKNSDPEEHFERKLFDVKMQLKPIDGTCFVEGLDSYHFPVVKPSKWRKGKLRKIVYAAGRRFAFPHEYLRYSAVIFNRPIEEDECSLVRWALEVDGNLQLLEGEEWYGTQIDLLMREEWLDKTITVIPYLKGHPIHRNVAIETTVKPYEMWIDRPAID